MLCDSTVFRPWMTKCPDYYLQKGMPVNYFECKSCKLIQQHPVPEDIDALYDGYPIHFERNTLQRLARRIFHRQIYFLPKPGSEFLNILDYGCGDGSFLSDVKRRFQKIYGFEPESSHALELSRRLNAKIYSSTENVRQELAGKIDIITAHFVLEHVSDLRETFKTFQILLRPGGILYVAVPNIRSWESRLFKKRWHGLDAPRHLVFPEPVHFEMLADQFEFNIINTSFAAFPNTLAASLATILSGRCHQLILMALIIPAWLISLWAPQSTRVIQMTKLKTDVRT